MTVLKLLAVIGAIAAVAFLFQAAPAIEHLVMVAIRGITLVVTRIAEIPAVEFSGPNAEWFTFGLRLACLAGVVFLLRFIFASRGGN